MTSWWHTKKSIVIKTALYTLLAKFVGMLKISLIVGSLATFFSFSSIVIPLSGAGTNGVLVATATFFIRLLLRLGITGGTLDSQGLIQRLVGRLLVYYLPGYCAALYWAVNRSWLRVGVPLLCIALFALHPVGYQALPCTFYWFIPLIVHFWFGNYLFATALGSTFTAHAVGSVMWLYTVPMTVSQCYALIPLVAFERLLYALGMTLFYRLTLLAHQSLTVGWHNLASSWWRKEVSSK